MTVLTRLATSLACFGLAIAPGGYAAKAQQQPPPPQQAAPYVPIVANFLGNGGLTYPFARALEINGSGTVEFWVSAKWNQGIGYDPAIMAVLGDKGPRFAFHIREDRRGFGLFVGDAYNEVPFDFSDGALHYVAVVTFSGITDIYIDGALRGSIEVDFADLPANQFTIGSIGGFSQFYGEIGQIRIWNTPVDEPVLYGYALRALDAAHPAQGNLVGMSAFANRETGGFVIVSNGDEVNTTLAP